MATRKKTITEPAFDARLIAAGIDKAELSNLLRDGYTKVYLYETKGLTLDEWQEAYFPIRASNEENQDKDMSNAIATGLVRNAKKIEIIVRPA